MQQLFSVQRPGHGDRAPDEHRRPPEAGHERLGGRAGQRPSRGGEGLGLVTRVEGGRKLRPPSIRTRPGARGRPRGLPGFDAQVRLQATHHEHRAADPRSMLIFCLMRVIPGDPTITKLGGSIREVDAPTLAASGASSASTSRSPCSTSTGSSGVVHGDFGRSYFSQFSVTTLLEQRIGATLLLALMAHADRAADRGASAVAGRDLAEPVAAAPRSRASPRSGWRRRRS